MTIQQGLGRLGATLERETQAYLEVCKQELRLHYPMDLEIYNKARELEFPQFRLWIETQLRVSELNNKSQK